MRSSLTVETWSDVICPWCYIDTETFVNVVRRVLTQNLAQTGVTND